MLKAHPHKLCIPVHACVATLTFLADICLPHQFLESKVLRKSGRKERGKEERGGKQKEIAGEMGEGGSRARKRRGRRGGEKKVGKRKRLHHHPPGIKKSHLPSGDFLCFQAQEENLLPLSDQAEAENTEPRSED